MSNSELVILISVAAIAISLTPLALAITTFYLDEKDRRAERDRWEKEDKIKNA